MQQSGLGRFRLRGVLFGEQDTAPLVPDLHLLDEHRRIYAFQDGCLGEIDLPIDVREFDFELGTGTGRVSR